MKNLIILLLLLISSLLAQNTMLIYKNSGDTLLVPVSSVDSIRFEEAPSVSINESWETGQNKWIFTNTKNTPIGISSNYPHTGDSTLSIGATPCNSGCQEYSGTATLVFDIPLSANEYTISWWAYENDNQTNSGMGYGRVGQLLINGEFAFQFDNYDHYNANPGWVNYSYTYVGEINNIAFRAFDMPEWGMVMSIDDITIISKP